MSEISNKEKRNNSLSVFINKIKSIKNIEIIIVIFTISIVLLIYFSSNSIFSDTSTEGVENIETTSYIDDLELKLNNVLSQIENAGRVKVMITIDKKTENTYAVNKEVKTTTSGNNTTTTTKEEVVIVQNEPIIISESLPKIKGVIVVAQGADNVNVKLELLKAVQTLLDIDAKDIEIFIGK